MVSRMRAKRSFDNPPPTIARKSSRHLYAVQYANIFFDHAIEHRAGWPGVPVPTVLVLTL
jgi:hypothetical protein